METKKQKFEKAVLVFLLWNAIASTTNILLMTVICVLGVFIIKDYTNTKD